jgi:citrate lyase subunit beta/citryl-CoA lyase
MTSVLLRSALYVPASNNRALARADSLGADAAIIDLEDSVAPDLKTAARFALAPLPVWSRTLRVIRVNGADTEWHEEDIAAACDVCPAALLMPKASSAEDVWAFRRRIALRRPKAPISAWAMIETPGGVINAPAIAGALGPGGVVVMGLNDLAKEAGMRAVAGRAPFLPALSAVVLAARAAGVACLDGVFNAIADTEGFSAECRQGRDFGFDGKTVIHPSQVADANAAFGPSKDEIATADAIVAAFARPENAGRGVLTLGGRMVERLHLAEAEALLARAAAIRAKVG